MRRWKATERLVCGKRENTSQTCRGLYSSIKYRSINFDFPTALSWSRASKEFSSKSKVRSNAWRAYSQENNFQIRVWKIIRISFNLFAITHILRKNWTATFEIWARKRKKKNQTFSRYNGIPLTPVISRDLICSRARG